MTHRFARPGSRVRFPPSARVSGRLVAEPPLGGVMPPPSLPSRTAVRTPPGWRAPTGRVLAREPEPGTVNLNRAPCTSTVIVTGEREGRDGASYERTRGSDVTAAAQASTLIVRVQIPRATPTRHRRAAGRGLPLRTIPLGHDLARRRAAPRAADRGLSPITTLPRSSPRPWTHVCAAGGPKA